MIIAKRELSLFSNVLCIFIHFVSHFVTEYYYMCAQQKSLAMSPLSFHMSFLMFKSGTYIKYTENLLLFPPLW